MTTTDPAPADVEEPIEVELVEEAPPSVAIEKASAPVPMPEASPLADLALIPTQNELQTLAQMAVTFSSSALVPKPLQDKPEDCMLVLLTARDLGLSVTVAFRECHPIDGRVTVSPKLKLAIVRQRSLGKVWPDKDNDVEHHTWYAARADDPETIYSVRYTWRDAQRAGLVQEGCTPDDHSDRCKAGSVWNATRAQKDHACKSNWRTYPGQMLQWRAMGYLMDQAFGEVGVGLYSADELGAVTDEDGHVIDIMEAGPLDGMPDRTPPAKDPATDPNGIAPEDIRAQFKERIHRLPDPAVDTIREQWSRKDRDQIPTIYPLPRLPLRQVKVADALISAFEARAEKGEWGPWNPPLLSWQAPQEATTEALGGVEADTAPEDGATQPEADTDAPPYDPKNPPSEVIEAAIDAANAIADDKLDEALIAAGQKPVDNHKPETKRRRLCQAWFVSGWLPETAADTTAE